MRVKSEFLAYAVERGTTAEWYRQNGGGAHLICHMRKYTRTYVPPVMENSRRERPRLSMYARERIRQLLAEGYTCSQVVSALTQVWRLEGHFKVHGTITPLPKSGRPTKLTDVAL